LISGVWAAAGVTIETVVNIATATATDVGQPRVGICDPAKAR
jgi:hypothetical protein